MRFDKISLKRELGGATERELINAQVLLKSDSSSLLSQELAVITARNTLNMALGNRPSDSIEVVAEIDLPPLTMTYEAWLEAAGARNSGLDAARRQVVLQELNQKLTKGLLWPSLSLSGSYTISQYGENLSDLAFDNLDSQRRFGLTATFNVLKGFSDYNQIRNDKLALLNSEFSYQSYSQLLESLVYQQYETVKNAYKKVTFEEDAVSLARRNFTISAEQHQSGSVSDLEFREAQLLLMRAKIGYYRSQFTARTALAELERLGGRIRISNDKLRIKN